MDCFGLEAAKQSTRTMSETTSLCKRSVRKEREGEAQSRAKRWATAFEVIRFAACAARPNGGAMAGGFGAFRLCLLVLSVHDTAEQLGGLMGFRRPNCEQVEKALPAPYHVFCLWRIGRKP